jgi:hypothetical protein
MTDYKKNRSCYISTVTVTSYEYVVPLTVNDGVSGVVLSLFSSWGRWTGR